MWGCSLMLAATSSSHFVTHISRCTNHLPPACGGTPTQLLSLHTPAWGFHNKFERLAALFITADSQCYAQLILL